MHPRLRARCEALAGRAASPRGWFLRVPADAPVNRLVRESSRPVELVYLHVGAVPERHYYLQIPRAGLYPELVTLPARELGVQETDLAKLASSTAWKHQADKLCAFDDDVGLRLAEELFVARDARWQRHERDVGTSRTSWVTCEAADWYRWEPEPTGQPLGEALEGWFPQLHEPAAIAGERAPIEQILDAVLEATTGKVHHLSANIDRRLSRAFRTRWGLQRIDDSATGERPLVTPESAAAVQFERDPLTSTEPITCHVGSYRSGTCIFEWALELRGAAVTRNDVVWFAS